MSDLTVGRLLRMLRVNAELTLADLAARMHYSRGHVHNVESGKRAANEDFTRAADTALDTGGLLTHRWHQEQNAAGGGDPRLERLLRASAAGSRTLAAIAGQDTDDLGADVADLATAYLASPPGPMLHDAHTVRQEVLARLQTRHHRPAERTELYRAAGHLSGILAYAALDLGHAGIAADHAQAAWRCADFAGDDELRVWVRGTQSLIARFRSDYAAALEFITDGLRYAAPGRGTGLARLLCGQAQCLANLHDSAGANAALNAAEDARDRAGADFLGGLFGFSLAKQRYYAGSSLIWLDGGPDAQRAAREAEAAIALWGEKGAVERSLDDEHLAHVYLATARAQLGDVDAAAAALGPVLGLPEDMRISWIVKRMGRLAALLEEPRFAGSAVARETAGAIRAAG
ncbi:helix-turn-helix domain-containing protein [Kitasatospora sp. NPDC052868]|uniref:helix-turn-helix domain-containing protein n=1 Tax=Kitasatospora sp. NPDC052868 TaxID=3364060 RepID=UPI0037C8A1C3